MGRRPTAVPAGLSVRRFAVAVHEQRKRDRWRSADPDRAGIHREIQCRCRRRVCKERNTLMSTQVDLAQHKVVHDERVKERNRVQRLLIRPEMGALIGAVVIFIFFTIVAPPFRTPEALATVLYGSSTIGIMACAVALLMIGGEFDLSPGVAATRTSLPAPLLPSNTHPT